jgi:hypothetical protein
MELKIKLLQFIITLISFYSTIDHPSFLGQIQTIIKMEVVKVRIIGQERNSWALCVNGLFQPYSHTRA